MERNFTRSWTFDFRNLMSDLTCWILTDGKAGTENQCLGLCDALGFTPHIKRIQLGGIHALLPASLASLSFFSPLPHLAKKDSSFEGPWPDVLIASGRPSVGVVQAIRRASNNRVFCVQIQNPRIACDAFDVVITPKHDQMSGENIFSTIGALHRVRLDRCLKARDLFLKETPLPKAKKYCAVLVGGNSHHFSLTPNVIKKWAASLEKMSEVYDTCFLVTTSRRTPPPMRVLLEDLFKPYPHYFWSGEGDNPYFAYLGLADDILVTEESVSMISEAVSLGKPVYMLPLHRTTSKKTKFSEFHQLLIRDIHVVLFAGVHGRGHNHSDL